jgi:hypothetical protein
VKNRAGHIDQSARCLSNGPGPYLAAQAHARGNCAGPGQMLLMLCSQSLDHPSAPSVFARGCNNSELCEANTTLMTCARLPFYAQQALVKAALLLLIKAYQDQRSGTPGRQPLLPLPQVEGITAQRRSGSKIHQTRDQTTRRTREGADEYVPSHLCVPLGRLSTERWRAGEGTSIRAF